MKNIHVLPTDKPSRLLQSLNVMELLDKEWLAPIGNVNRHIYITSDEEIKEGDWIFDLDTKSIVKADSFKVITSKKSQCWYYKKIILTTDQDLIKDGVQAIPDEFLEWYVKNPSCERVEVEDVYKKFLNGDKRSVSDFRNKYKIIIPKEKPKQEFLKQKRMSGAKTVSRILEESKQETLEEAAEKYSENWEETTGLDYENTVPSEVNKLDFINGAKWQSERMYSEEDIIDLIQFLSMNKEFNEYSSVSKETARYFLEQFKKK